MKGRRQLVLPGILPGPTRVDRVVGELVGQWLAEVDTLQQPIRMSRAADYLSLSCLALSTSPGLTFHSASARRVTAALEELLKRGGSAADCMPWRLTNAVMEGGTRATDSEAVALLVANLDHHNSGVRNWMLEIAWIARPVLVGSAALPVLLLNVADKLVGVEKSAGLAASLLPSEEQFWLEANEYEPPPQFADQYRARIVSLRRKGLIAAQGPLWKLEATCWQVISRAALGAKPARS